MRPRVEQGLLRGALFRFATPAEALGVLKDFRAALIGSGSPFYSRHGSVCGVSLFTLFIIQQRFHGDTQITRLAGIAVHLGALTGLKMIDAAAKTDNFAVLRDLYSFGEALGGHFFKKSRLAR